MRGPAVGQIIHSGCGWSNREKEQSVCETLQSPARCDAEDRMSDQGLTKDLSVPKVVNPALEVTTRPREAMTVEREVSTPGKGDQLQEGSS